MLYAKYKKYTYFFKYPDYQKEDRKWLQDLVVKKFFSTAIFNFSIFNKQFVLFWPIYAPLQRALLCIFGPKMQLT
jgi:hypothetical protein